MQKTHIILLLILVVNLISCQTTKKTQIHSHNDYAQQIPLYNALAHGATSIEIDVFLKNGILYVTHAEADIVFEDDIETLYLKPLTKKLSENSFVIKEVQLLIDFKSEAKTTLEQLIKTLSGYPELIQSDKISVVISGNRPPLEEYIKYPAYILFDYQSLDKIGQPQIWKKIALISLPYHRFSKWTGETKMPPEDYKTLKAVVDKAHKNHKPFRFWGTPDTKLAWKTFAQMKVDFINTDSPAECVQYFKNKE